MCLNEKLTAIRQRIAAACHRASRDPAEVTLVTVSKGHPPKRVAEAVEAGLTVFGENKVQELKLKVGQCPGHLRWDFIGHLQTNKCRDAAYFAHLIHSVDSDRVANALNAAGEKLAKTIPILLEVNVSGEATKYGFSPDELREGLLALNDYDRLEIHGLMTMAPWSTEAEKTRPYFRRLRELRDELETLLGAPLPELSMGMSRDFEVAIEEGATLVRVGTDLMGERKRR